MNRSGNTPCDGGSLQAEEVSNLKRATVTVILVVALVLLALAVYSFRYTMECGQRSSPGRGGRISRPECLVLDRWTGEVEVAPAPQPSPTLPVSSSRIAESDKNFRLERLREVLKARADSIAAVKAARAERDSLTEAGE